MSFDSEFSATLEQIYELAFVLQRLKAALNPLGARVTIYSDYTTLINNITLLSSVTDRVLGGQTYNAFNYSDWIDSLVCMVNIDVPREKISPGQLGATERGSWNCNVTGMQERLNYLISVNVSEISVFSMSHINGTNSNFTFCTTSWFPYLRDFLLS